MRGTREWVLPGTWGIRQWIPHATLSSNYFLVVRVSRKARPVNEIGLKSMSVDLS